MNLQFNTTWQEIMKSTRRLIKSHLNKTTSFVVFCVFTFVVLLGFQNCSNGQNISFQSLKTLSLSSQASSNESGGVSGNGSGYEGKPEGIFVRNLPGTACEKSFEVLEISKTKQTVATTSQTTCETTTRTIDDSLLEYSTTQKQVVAVGDGLFINTETLNNGELKTEILNKKNNVEENKAKEPNQPSTIETQLATQAWCQAEVKNQIRFDILVFENFKTSQLNARIFQKDLTTANGSVASAPDFPVTSVKQQRELQLTAPSFALKIDLTNLPKVSNGNFNAALDMNLNQKQLNFTKIECRAGGSFDGAIWPSRIFAPAITHKLTQFIGFSKLTNSAILTFDPVGQARDFFSLSLNENSPKQDSESSNVEHLEFNLNQDEFVDVTTPNSTSIRGHNLLMRTYSNAQPNRNRVFDLVTKQNLFTTDTSSQSVDIGSSESVSWSISRSIRSYNTNGEMKLTGPERITYFPNGSAQSGSPSQKLVDFEPLLPERDRFIKFIYLDAHPKKDLVLFSVSFGESVEMHPDGRLGRNSKSFLSDLAILNTKTGQLNFLKMWSLGKDFHLPYASDHEISAGLFPYFLDASGENVIAVVHDNSFVRLIRFNFITRQTVELVKFSKSNASLEVQSRCGGFWSNCFSRFRNKILWLDEQQVYQVLDAESGVTTALGPFIRSVSPVFLAEANQILYYRVLSEESIPEESRNTSGFIRTRLVPLTLGISDSVVHNYPDTMAIEFKAPPFVSSITLSGPRAKDPMQVFLQKFDSRTRFAKQLIFSETFYFMADRDLDGQFELYKSNGSAPPQLISDRYIEYGGVTDFYVNEMGQVFFTTKKDSVPMLFKWTGD